MSTTGRLKSTISWRPRRIDFTLENLDTAEVQSWTYTGADLPKAPGSTEFRINAWISDKSIYNASSTLDVAVESVSFATLQPDPTPKTKVWIGAGTPSWQQDQWSNATNWSELPETPPAGYGGKIVFGAQDQVTSSVGMPSSSPVALGELVFEGQRALDYIGPTGVSTVNFGTLAFSNGYVNGIYGSLRDSAITMKAGTGLLQNTAIFPAVTLDGNLQIVVRSASDKLAFEGNMSGAGALVLPASNAGRVVLRTLEMFRSNYPDWPGLGPNSFQGGTIVNGGTLEVANSFGLPEQSSLAVGPAGRVEFTTGPGTWHSVASHLGPVSNDGHVAIEGAVVAQAISGTGSTMVGGALTADSIRQDTLTVDAGGKVAITGGGTSVVNFLNIANGSGNFSWEVGGNGMSGNQSAAAPVPEPATWGLMAVALGTGIMVWRRRQR